MAPRPDSRVDVRDCTARRGAIGGSIGWGSGGVARGHCEGSISERPGKIELAYHRVRRRYRFMDNGNGVGVLDKAIPRGVRNADKPICPDSRRMHVVVRHCSRSLAQLESAGPIAH